MTVAATTSRVDFTGNDVTTVFDTSPLVFFDATDLLVYDILDSTSVATLKTLTTHYTVTGGDNATGTVTMLTAPASGHTLLILRDIPITQLTDLENNEINDADVMEEALDKLTLLIQQVDERVDRTLQLPVGLETGFPLPEPDALKVLQWNAAETGLQNVALAEGTFAVTPFMETLLDDTTAAEARTTLGITAGSANGPSGYILNMVGGTTAGPSTTQYDFDCDIVVLGHAAAGTLVSHSAPAILTNNTATSGPAANGRDRSAAFSVSTWVHFYYISNGTTLATISSANGPSVGPAALPSGYTHWQYITAIYKNGSDVLEWTVLRGDTVTLMTVNAALSSGSATSATAVDVATKVPPNAVDYVLTAEDVTITASAGGIISALCQMIINPSNLYTYLAKIIVQGLTGSVAYSTRGATITVPNIGQSFSYAWTVTTGSSQSITLYLKSYRTTSRS